MKKHRILIGAGGTGGHLIPAQQLAAILKEKHYCEEVLFAAKGISKNRFFQSETFSCIDIASSPLTKKNIFSCCFFLLKGFFQSIVLLRSFKATVVIGFGSFHSFPLMLAARCMRVDYILFESNVILGKTQRFFAKKAKFVAVQFPLINYCRSNMAVVNMLPWAKKEKKFSKEIALKYFSLSTHKACTFLVFGGSQGATFINRLFLECTKKLHRLGLGDFQVMHIVGGSQNIEQVQQHYFSLCIPAVVKSFENNMSMAFSAADVVISRGGASAIAEILTYELPSIIIPYPHASEGHQQKNALFMKKEVKGSFVFLQEMQKHIFYDMVMQMLGAQSRVNCIKNIQKYKKNRLLSGERNLEHMIEQI